MKIIIAPRAGACRGVRRALDKTRSALQATPGHVLCLQDIVHNRQVMSRLYRDGLRQISDLSRAKTEDTLIINTHGTGPDIYLRARLQGIKIIDTTCSLVKNLQFLARRLVNSNYRLIIAGDPHHPETRGIVDWTGGRAVVVSQNENILFPFPSGAPVALISQTTFAPDRFELIARLLKKNYQNIKVHKTICPSTELRRQEALQLAEKMNTFWVIGSPDSANTLALLQAVKAIQPNARLIQDTADIEPDYLNGIASLGITAGASVPDWIIKDVVDRTKCLAQNAGIFALAVR